MCSRFRTKRIIIIKMDVQSHTMTSLLKSGLRQTTAASPVIGTVLMVAVTLVIAATLMILVMEMAEQAQPDILFDEPYHQGTGTLDDPFLIRSIEQLSNLRQNLSAHYALEADIDASATADWNDGAGFLPIGDSDDRFLGSLDGRGHGISGLVIDRPSENSVALFSYLGSGSKISNLTLSDTDIGGRDFVSAISAWNYGTVVNVHVGGDIDGRQWLGAITGRNHGTVDRCSSDSMISANGERVGGLVAHNSGQGVIRDSYVLGAVASPGKEYVGGLLGSNANNGIVERVYSAASVSGGTTNVGGLIGSNDGMVSRSYWDLQTSGQATSGDGEGRTTAQMRSQGNYEDWNFTTVWSIQSGDYPRLR